MKANGSIQRPIDNIPVFQRRKTMTTAPRQKARQLLLQHKHPILKGPQPDL
jgi:hypothetical protein